MGPKSTGPFIDLVVSTYQVVTGAVYDVDFPHMMIYSLPTPFYTDRPIDHHLMQKVICEGLKRLENCGVVFIAMPCNTAHIYYEALQKCVRVPLLNMITETLKSIPSTAKKIAILGTRPTMDSHVYQNELKKMGLEDVLHVVDQSKIDHLIKTAKEQRDPRELRNCWMQLSDDLSLNQVDTLLIACTDLSTFFTQAQEKFQIVDSSHCLARAVAESVNKFPIRPV